MAQRPEKHLENIQLNLSPWPDKQPCILFSATVLKRHMIHLQDEDVYRCRVDYRNSPTRNVKLNLTVVGECFIEWQCNSDWELKSNPLPLLEQCACGFCAQTLYSVPPLSVALSHISSFLLHSFGWLMQWKMTRNASRAPGHFSNPYLTLLRLRSELKKFQLLSLFCLKRSCL